MISKKILSEMQKGSWIRKMFEEGIKLKKQFGADNVFDMSLGNPEVEPPAKFKQKLKQLVSDSKVGMHRYMPNAGYPETRAYIAEILNKESAVNLTSNDVTMTCGAAGALNVVLKSLFNAGDEVIILAPYFVEYVYYLDNHGLTCKIVDTDENFLPDIKALDRAISEKTKGIIINSPNNPTGVVYDERVVKSMADLLATRKRKDIAIILDDAYGKLVYDRAKNPCIFNYHTNTLICASFSKTLSVPGERIGYIAINPNYESHDDATSAFAFCNRILGFVNAPAIMQHAVVGTADEIVDPLIYKKKRDYLYDNLTKAGYEIVKPHGAFYLFPKTPIKDDVAFVTKLLDQKVLAVPGSGFGRAGYMRLSYCVDDKVIEGAVKGLIKAFVK